MSHECPRCSEWCHCDGEDSPSSTAEHDTRYCIHVCAQDQGDECECADAGDVTVTAGSGEVKLKLADGSMRILRSGETLKLVQVAGGMMPRRCSDTCDGPGPDVVDQGPDPADSIEIPCTTCGRREPPTPAAPIADPAPYGEGSLPDRLCVQCGQRERRKGRRRSPACRICDRDNKRLKRRARAALNAAQGTWVVLRHGGRSTDDWRVVGRVASEVRARATFVRLHDAMRQGGVRLVSPEGKVAASEWAPRLRTHW